MFQLLSTIVDLMQIHESLKEKSIDKALIETFEHFHDRNIEFPTDVLKDVFAEYIIQEKATSSDELLNKVAKRFMDMADVHFEDDPDKNLLISEEIVNFFAKRIRHHVFDLGNELLESQVSGIEKDIQFLLNRMNILRDHLLDEIIENSRYGIPPELKYELRDELNYSEELLDFTKPVLMHGPPWVGKTCLAIRRAWHWEKLHEGTAIYVNVRHHEHKCLTEIANELALSLSDGVDILYIIDNIHYADEKTDLGYWSDGMQNVLRSELAHKCNIYTLWIARDSSIADKLLSKRLIDQPVSVKHIFDVFMKYSQKLQRWQQIIAVFESDLNPNIIRDSEYAPNEFDLFAKWIKKQVRTRFDRQLRDLHIEIDDKGYDIYTFLLPFGSIGYPLDRNYTDEIGVTPKHRRSLIDGGWAEEKEVKSDPSRLLLTKHPFQCRQELKIIPRSWNKWVSNYLHSKPSIEWIPILKEFDSYTKWSGVRDSLEQGLAYLLDNTCYTSDNTEAIHYAQNLRRRLTRYSYYSHENESSFIDTMNRDIEFWSNQRGIAKHDSHFQAGGNRLDMILYEMAIGNFFLENYEKARELFAESVHIGLDLIKKGIKSNSDDTQKQDAVLAFREIWVGASLERATRIRQLLLNAINEGQLSEQAEKEILDLAKQTTRIYERLDYIYDKINNDEFWKSSPCLNTDIFDILCPENPLSQDKFSLTVKSKNDIDAIIGRIDRHRLNTWIDSVKASCLPVLFGFTEKPIALPSKDYRNDQMPSGIPLYKVQGVQVLRLWSEKKNQSDLGDEAIAISAIMQTAGIADYLGEQILLAWRCASSDEVANALAWYLQNRVPDVGLNGLSKKALGRLAEMSIRQ